MSNGSQDDLTGAYRRRHNVEVADARLYRAKALGRNRVVGE